MADQVANPTIIVNNETISVSPNSVEYDEGLGEQTMRSQSSGGAQIETVYAENVETNFSMIKFDMAATIANIALARSWKINKNQNLVQLVARTADGDLSRTFAKAGFLPNYVVPLGSDGNISIEFRAQPAI